MKWYPDTLFQSGISFLSIKWVLKTTTLMFVLTFLLDEFFLPSYLKFKRMTLNSLRRTSLFTIKISQDLKFWIAYFCEKDYCVHRLSNILPFKKEKYFKLENPFPGYSSRQFNLFDHTIEFLLPWLCSLGWRNKLTVGGI